MLLTVATAFTDHLAAWGTVAAALGTVLTLAFLVTQLAIEWAARRRRREREQAESVSAWVGSDYLPTGPPSHAGSEMQRVELLNGSHEPVYEVVALLAMLQRGPGTSPEGHLATNQYGAYHMRCLSVFPPGRHATSVQRAPTVMYRRYGVELAFTDRAGVHWRRAVNGRLHQIKLRPSEHYSLPAPLDWGVPQEVGITGPEEGQSSLNPGPVGASIAALPSGGGAFRALARRLRRGQSPPQGSRPG